MCVCVCVCRDQAHLYKWHKYYPLVAADSVNRRLLSIVVHSITGRVSVYNGHFVGHMYHLMPQSMMYLEAMEYFQDRLFEVVTAVLLQTLLKLHNLPAEFRSLCKRKEQVEARLRKKKKKKKDLKRLKVDS